MGGLQWKDFLGMFFQMIVSNLFLYYFICLRFPLKISKRSALLIGSICAMYLPIIDTLLTILVGGKVIPLSIPLIIIIKLNSLVCEVLLIIFICLAVKLAWYRCYCVTIIMHFILILPYPILYATFFLNMESVRGITFIGISRDNILLYIGCLLASLIWGFLVIRFFRIKSLPIILDRVPKLGWMFLYLLWGLLIVNTDKYLDTSEYKKVITYNFTEELFVWFSTFYEVILFMLIIGIVFGTSFFIFEQRQLKKENHMLKALNEVRYKDYLSMQQMENEIHKLYHDIGNHIHTIQLLVVNGDNEEAQIYTEKLLLQFQNVRKNYYCSNKIINAVLLQKCSVCDQNNIEYELDIKLPKQLGIDEIDLMSVFSNLVDNAIEGCLRNPGQANRIKIITNVIGSYFAIKIINTKARSGKNQTEINTFITLKADKKNHGYGLKIIEEILHRYDGQKEIRDYGEEFSALVMLKLKS